MEIRCFGRSTEVRLVSGRLIAGCAFLLMVAACTGADNSSGLPGGGQGGASSAGSPATVASGSGAIGGSEAGTSGAAGAASAGAAPAGGGISGAGGGGGESPGAEDPVCVDVTESCQSEADCCGDLSCGTTSLGQVCCGQVGASCATANGEDCCGDLLCVAGQCTAADAAPLFQAPFPCGESWTYSHHSAEVRRALDFVRDSGGSDGAPVLAAASGLATRHSQPSGAGNYIAVEHTGGWKTYYFHLQSYSVADGTSVTQGQEVGRVGSTGASSGPHLHFEELLDGVGQDIVLNQEALSPYPGSYGQKSVTSHNCP